MTESLLLCEQRDGVAVVTFNDPDRLNAMTEPMGQAIAAEIARLAEDTDIRAVVLTGAGRAFSAGGDLAMIERLARDGSEDPGGDTRARNRTFMERFYHLYLSVAELPQPSLAAINGHAIGAGLCIALACDIRVSARQAKLGLNFSRLGIHPGMAATWTLPRIVGPAHAADLLYTGRILDGVEAERIGLVNRAVDQDVVLESTLETARAIADAAPLAVQGARRSLAASQGSDLETQLAREASEQALCYESEDLLEGLAAVRGRREPHFRGS